MQRARLLVGVLVAAATLIAPASGAVNSVDSTSTSQTAKLRVHPQIAQPGDVVGSADAARTALSAEFRPAKAGRTVTLQRKSGDSWTQVATARQNGRGIAEFTALAKYGESAAVYRAVAARYDGLPRIATAEGATDRWGRPDFSDEFTSVLNETAWTDRLQGYSVDSLRKCSKADERARAVGGGVVKLSVKKDPDRSGKCQYKGRSYAWRINGHIGTQGSTYFKYGYAAARIKFQPRRGQHGSFWLQPEAPAATKGSALSTGAEIDVIEWFGNNYPGGGLASFIYYNPDGTRVKVGGLIKNQDRFGSGWASRYHVFSVEWTPQRYIFRIDGKETFRTSTGVSGQRQYLILSLLSSDYELAHLGGDSHLPQEMSVDWVRVWDRTKDGTAPDTVGG